MPARSCRKRCATCNELEILNTMTDAAQWDMNLRALPGIPQIGVGDDLGKIITDAVAADGHILQEGDVIVVAQEVVSKTEDRVVRLCL